MKNVTITLPDDLASRVRVDAAKAGKSMSRYIADILDERDDLRARQIAAMAAFLACPREAISDENGRLPDREELYRRDILRGHEYPDLQPGRQQPGEGDAGERSARGTRAAKRDVA